MELSYIVASSSVSTTITTEYIIKNKNKNFVRQYLGFTNVLMYSVIFFLLWIYHIYIISSLIA